MSGIEALLREVRELDAAGSQSSGLSGITPRATVLATLAYILVVVSFDRYAVAPMLPMVIFPVAVARLGNVELVRIGRKVLLAMPFALMVGIFNPVFDTVPRMELMGYAVPGGWLSLASILIRAILTIAAALILVATLGIYGFCAALNQLGLPRVFTTQLQFMHRYTLVLAGELGRMNLARELRSNTSATMPPSVYGSLLGHLLLRTLDRAQRIHQAMLSRGFDRHVPVPLRQSWRWRDTFFLTICMGTFYLMRTTDLATLLGRQLLRVAS